LGGIQTEDFPIEETTWNLRDVCLKIAGNLGEEGISEHVDHLVAVAAEEMDFSLLAKTIRESIEQNEPGILRVISVSILPFSSKCLIYSPKML
jgi:hypothetical protein